MIKRIIAVIFVTIMAFISCAFAESTEISSTRIIDTVHEHAAQQDAVKSIPSSTDEDSSKEMFKDFSIDSPYVIEKSDQLIDKATVKSDTVEITDGNQYAVLTSEGIGIAYEIKEDDVYVLTQDYVAQAELFAAFYDKPLEAVTKFVRNSIHMNIYDSKSKVDIFVSIRERDWSTIYPDTAKLSDAEIGFLADYLGRMYFSNAVFSTFGYAGNNQYFYFDCHTIDKTVYMLTTAGGYQIMVSFSAENMEQISRALDLIESLTIVKL